MYYTTMSSSCLSFVLNYPHYMLICVFCGMSYPSFMLNYLSTFKIAKLSGSFVHFCSFLLLHMYDNFRRLNVDWLNQLQIKTRVYVKDWRIAYKDRWFHYKDKQFIQKKTVCTQNKKKKKIVIKVNGLHYFSVPMPRKALGVFG